MKFELYEVVAGFASLAATFVVVELIRRRRLEHVLWLPWLAAALLPAILGAWVRPWASFARWLGIAYEPLLLVALASLVSYALLLYLTVVVSSLMQKNLLLAQELALLKSRLDEISAVPARGPAPPSAARGRST